MGSPIDRKLLAFTKIVETKSYSAAADALYISQSALSQQIKLLERELGFELFDHRSHQAKLTYAGEVFYSKAVQLLALYREALRDSLCASRTENVRKQRLHLVTYRELYLQLWRDIDSYGEDLGSQFSPYFTHHEDRSRMLLAIRTGEADLGLEIENTDVDAFGLIFTPIATFHELCFPSKAKIQIQHEKPYLSLSEICQYALFFHNPPGQTVFEDALREQLRKEYPDTPIIERDTTPSVDYECDVLVLAPSVQVPNPQYKGAVPLEWGGNLRVGFVTNPDCPPRIFSFVEYVRDQFLQTGGPWI